MNLYNKTKITWNENYSFDTTNFKYINWYDIKIIQKKINNINFINSLKTFPKNKIILDLEKQYNNDIGTILIFTRPLFINIVDVKYFIPSNLIDLINNVNIFEEKKLIQIISNLLLRYSEIINKNGKTIIQSVGRTLFGYRIFEIIIKTLDEAHIENISKNDKYSGSDIMIFVLQILYRLGIKKYGDLGGLTTAAGGKIRELLDEYGEWLYIHMWTGSYHGMRVESELLILEPDFDKIRKLFSQKKRG